MKNLFAPLKSKINNFDINADTKLGLTNHQVLACVCMFSTVITLTSVVMHISQAVLVVA